MSEAKGIYVEILIQESLERIWQLTQVPELHQLWDLRFTQIRYLPRPDPTEPQRFLYETRIGFGLCIHGTGESTGTRSSELGEATSALRFASDDPKSLIREGSGYWRYVPTEDGLRFFTWYDYQVRFGVCGRVLDRVIFKPVMGWATAWSFDRLRLWAETGQPPETSLLLTFVHGVSRITVAFVWIWHGLVPKLLFQNRDELIMLSQSGVRLSWLPWLGMGEVAFGILLVLAWRWRTAYLLSGALMVLALVGVIWHSSSYVTAAFTPVTLNASVLAFCVTGYISSKRIPTANRCLRSAPGVRT